MLVFKVTLEMIRPKEETVLKVKQSSQAAQRGGDDKI